MASIFVSKRNDPEIYQFLSIGLSVKLSVSPNEIYIFLPGETPIEISLSHISENKYIITKSSFILDFTSQEDEIITDEIEILRNEIIPDEIENALLLHSKIILIKLEDINIISSFDNIFQIKDIIPLYSPPENKSSLFVYTDVENLKYLHVSYVVPPLSLSVPDEIDRLKEIIKTKENINISLFSSSEEFISILVLYYSHICKNFTYKNLCGDDAVLYILTIMGCSKNLPQSS